MSKETITIEVPPGTARAYEGASPLDRERVRQALVFALQTPGDATAELRRILDTIGTKAREHGLTEEKLDELLGGE